jgi:nudix-type nucleoside diphosphatase (YffH/AdpP family)
VSDGAARRPGRRVEILARRRLYDAFFKLDLLELRHERFDGGWTPPLRRELFIQRPAVVALPYEPARDLVVLVEQFRTGCVDHPGEPWLIEAVAGLVEEGEAPEAVARREVREETGLEATPVEKLGDIRYWYARDGDRVLKVVSFFLLRYRSGRLADHDHEVEEALWIPLEEAPGRLAYKSEKEIARTALSRVLPGS